MKNIISVINSYPILYSILTSKFFFLEKFNPRIYRNNLFWYGIIKQKIR